MATLPASLLNRLYEPDSLRNTRDGFELAFKNRLAPSTMIAVGPLKIDGRRFEGTALTLRVERPALGHGRPPDPLLRVGDEVTSARSLPFGLNAVARILVAGASLPPGEYELSWSFKTLEVGDITVYATDVVPED